MTALSRSINNRDEQVQQLLAHAKTVSDVLARRSEQMNQLIVDGNQLFAALSDKRQSLGILITGIDDLARQISGFVADNRKEFGPALTKLNLVLDNLETRRAQIDDSLRRLPSFASQLGEVVGSGPGFSANVYGVPPAADHRDGAGRLLPTRQAARQPVRLPTRLHRRPRHHQAEVTMSAITKSTWRAAAAQRRSRRPDRDAGDGHLPGVAAPAVRCRSRRTSPRPSGCIRATR